MQETANIIPLEQKPIKKAGRPKRILTDTEYDIIDRACQIGLTHEQISKLLNMSLRSFAGFVSRDKKIKEFVTKGKLKTDLFVAGQLLKKIKDGDKTCIIFYLKTRMGWKETDKQEIEVKKVDKAEIAKDIETKLFGE